MRALLLICGMLVLLFDLSAQEITPPVSISKPPPVGIIHFISKVNLASVGWLMAKVSEFQQQGITEINILLLSAGGDTDAGIAGYNYLTSLPLTLNTYNLADTSSAAAYLFCAGTRRFAYPRAKFLLHGAKTHFTEAISFDELTLEHQQSQLRHDSTAEILTACLNATPSEIAQILKTGALFSSATALKAGLIEGIVNTSPSPLNNAVFTIKDVD